MGRGIGVKCYLDTSGGIYQGMVYVSCFLRGALRILIPLLRHRRRQFFGEENSFHVNLKFLLIFSLPILILVGTLKDSSAGQRKKQEKRSKVARLRNESAVYEAPNFDSPVKLFFSKGKKVRYFLKRYKGPGNFGVFYKVKIRRGEYGYVVEDDIDVSKGLVKSPMDSGGIEGPFKEIPFDTDDGPNLGDSIYLSRYVGLTYSQINYSEDVAGRSLSASTGFLGLKFSGPGVLIGAPLDVNIMLLPQTPSYYKRFASATTGFLLVSDIVFMLPLVEWEGALLYYGVGPLVTYSKYNVALRSSRLTLDSQEIRMGASFPLGVAIKLGKALVKAEAKYYFEKKKYFGFQLGVQLAY